MGKEAWRWWHARKLKERRAQLAEELLLLGHIVYFARASNGGAGILEEPWIWYVRCNLCGIVRKYDAKLNVMESWGDKWCPHKNTNWTGGGELIVRRDEYRRKW